MAYFLGYVLCCLAFVFWYERRKQQTKEHFFVADRRISGTDGAMSIAASWVWAPALFISTMVGYKYGFSGLVWFTIPNILALSLFGPLAQKLRRMMPEGFSYIDFLESGWNGFKNIQLFMQLFVQVICFAIQLVAGAKLLSMISGVGYEWIVVLMAITPLTYSLISGLSSSVATDAVQYAVMVLCIILIYFGVSGEISLGALAQAKFQPFDPKMMVEFGLLSAMTLLFGIFSDHQHWQRAFSVKGNVAGVYVAGGLLHGLITFSLGTLGVALAMSGYTTGNVQMVGVEFVRSIGSEVLIGAYVILALCGLCSTLDSALCAFSSLYALHVRRTADPIKASREGMVILTLGSMAVALMNVPLIALWMFAGLIRLGTVFPTFASVLREDFDHRAGAASIILSVTLCAPMFIYAHFLDVALIKLFSMAGCLALSPAAYFTFKKLNEARQMKLASA